MSRLEITTLSLKITAILSILLGILALENFTGYVIFTLNSREASAIAPGYFFLIGFVPVILLLICGVLLYIFSDSWSIIFWDKSVLKDEESGIKAQEVQTLAFSIVGILLVALAVPKLFKVLITFYEFIRPTDRIPGIYYLIRDIILTLIQLGIGIYLFAGARGLSRIWSKIQQTRGFHQQTDPD